MSFARRGAWAATAAVVGILALGFASMTATAPEPTGPRAEVELLEGRVRVEVLNGGGVTGMAREATVLLRSIGFDVVDFGNAPSFDDERPSVVIDRVGRTDWAQAVAVGLGIDNVLSEPDPNLYVDVSVVVGSAWRNPTSAPVTRAQRPRRAWWDPRGWLGR